MGSVDEAMTRIRVIFFILFNSLTLFLHADKEIERLRQSLRIVYQNHLLQGWCSEEKALLFFDLAMQVKPKVCVEIGVFGGASLFPVAYALRNLGQGIIIGIDPYENAECIKDMDSVAAKEHIAWWSRVNLYDVYDYFIDNLTLYGLYDYCTIVKKSSSHAIHEINHIDILHIDGHISEAQIFQDVALYLPKVNPGGYIWIGDTLGFNKQKGLELLLEYCDIVKIVENGNCILFKKR